MADRSGSAYGMMAAGEDAAPVLTKVPPWHDLVGIDLFLSSLAAGVFTVSELARLLAPAAYAPVAEVGFLIAFPTVVADLIFLVLHLGEPLRFHHMMRVLRLGSPMSVGAWATPAFALAALICFVLTLAKPPGFGVVRSAVGLAGLAAALLVASYKGVLLSTTAQPGWRDARYMGAALSTSAGALGAATMLIVARATGAERAAAGLRAALLALTALNLIAATMVIASMRRELTARFSGAELAALRLLAVSLGLVAPLAIVTVEIVGALASPSADITAGALTLIGALAFRRALVMLPHRASAKRASAL